MPAAALPPHGLLVVDKPLGPTSHDVVAQARRLFGTRKVGHAGTLDPMASGVLVVLFGEATKLAAYLTAQNKRYLAVVEFGRATDSYDSVGTTTASTELPAGWRHAEALAAALQTERDRVEQTPPAFSALKVEGKRAHRLARAGTPPILAARAVRVQSIELLAEDDRTVTVEIAVSKGYYVRSLARDLGVTLGVPSHLLSLRRLASGCFTSAEACPWPTENRPPLLSLYDTVQRAMPCLELTATGLAKAIKGQRLEAEDLSDNARAMPENEPAAWLVGTRLVAIGTRQRDSFMVKRGFASEPQQV